MDINDLISGILGSATPTPGGGILSGLPSSSTNLGLALLANSGPTRLPTTFGQALGQSAIQAQDMQSQAVARRAQLAQSLLGLQMAQGRMAAFQNAMGGAPQQGGPPAGQAPMGAPGAAPGAAAGPPSAATPSPQVQASNTNSPLAKWLNPPSPSDISSTPVGPFANASAYPDLAFFSGQDPVKAAQEVHAQQLQLMQQRYAPQIAKLAGVVQSDNPSRDVKADPTLTALWQQYAGQRGLDPSLTGKDYTDANLRQVFGGAANQFRAALSESGVAPPVPLRTSTLPDGRIVQTDPVTGKQTIQAPSPLEKVVGPNGPELVPAAKAAGMKPYNQFNTATGDDIQALAQQVASYRLSPPTGSRLLSGAWPAVMAQVRQINPNYDATQYVAKNKARQAFATGKQGDIVRSLSVATDHLDQLSQAAHALSQSDLPTVNKIVNGFATATGNPSVTTFDAMKEIVGDEVVKSVVGSSGAEGDRNAIKQAFSSAKSPQQLEQVVQHYEGLMGGQLSGLRRQYQRSTGLTDFNDMVSDSAQRQLSGADTASGSAPSLSIGQSTTVGQFKVTRVK